MAGSGSPGEPVTDGIAAASASQNASASKALMWLPSASSAPSVHWWTMIARSASSTCQAASSRSSASRSSGQSIALRANEVNEVNEVIGSPIAFPRFPRLPRLLVPNHVPDCRTTLRALDFLRCDFPHLLEERERLGEPFGGEVALEHVVQ